MVSFHFRGGRGRGGLRKMVITFHFLATLNFIYGPLFCNTKRPRGMQGHQSIKTIPPNTFVLYYPRISHLQCNYITLINHFQLLQYASTTLLFSDKKIDETIINWNRVILLHGKYFYRFLTIHIVNDLAYP